jgi:hypothetical protein
LYDFKQLSPADLEDLARDLLQQHWKITLESFKNGRDKGIDLRYSTVRRHSLIVQCKHYAGSGIAKLVRDLRTKEMPKVTRLAPDRYVLVTSIPLNPDDKEKIKSALEPYILSTDDILGAESLNNLLGLYSEIEGKHFKLWLSSMAVLQRVLHNAERVQTDFDVDRVRRAIPLYVQNANYSRALKILDEQKVVIISGVPGIGKTTLADMLLYAHLESSFEPVVIKSEIAEGRRWFNNDAKQVFYFDDFLGETFLGNRFDFVGKKEDSAILDFIEMIARSKHARLILTTREHILQHAFQISERFQRGKGALADHRCILELASYSLLDRARILYNHIYFSDLPKPYKAKLLRDQFYMKVLKHRNFNPRLVEWLSKFTNVRLFPISDYCNEVERILENPTQLWRIAFEQQISEASRGLLLALYSLGGSAPLDRLEAAWKIIHKCRAARYNWKTAAEDWRRSLQDLEGGFISFTGGKFGVPMGASFVNPSVKDFLDATLVSDVDHLDDLLAATNTFEQVVNLWALVISDKGGQLQKRFESSPEKLMEVVSAILPRPPVEIKTGIDSRSYRYDVIPEIRLKTLVSIADRTQSFSALEAIAAYIKMVLEYWEGQWANFVEAVAVLRVLDNTLWSPLSAAKFHDELKTAILSELSLGVGTVDIAAVVGYADSDGARWNDQDQKLLTASFEHYLEERFSEELGECDSGTDLEALASALKLIAARCGTDVRYYQNEIEERATELARPDDNDDNRPIAKGDGESSGVMSEEMQEAEVMRLFDGLT